jgi:hypothetical protein
MNIIEYFKLLFGFSGQLILLPHLVCESGKSSTDTKLFSSNLLVNLIENSMGLGPL